MGLPEPVRSQHSKGYRSSTVFCVQYEEEFERAERTGAGRGRGAHLVLHSTA